MARCVRDVALLLDVISGHDARDPGSIAEAPIDATAQLAKSVRGLRVGWVASLGYGHVDAEVEAACREAASRLSGEGSIVKTVAGQLFEKDPGLAWNEVFYGAIGERVRQLASGDVANADIDAALKAVLLHRRTVSPGDVAHQRDTCIARVHDAFERFDILAMPTMPMTAPLVGIDVPPSHEGRNPVDWSYFTYPFNLCGNPAVSMPVTLSRAGMPIGLQLVARWGDDLTLIAAAAALERVLSAGAPNLTRVPPSFGRGA
jgi:Asp-tRNA(Asn)/Glu-tRNA(Gln) amidotransferase A subunit family amidase